MFIKIQKPSDNGIAFDKELYNSDHFMQLVLTKNKQIVAVVSEMFILSILTTPPGSIKPNIPNTIILGEYSTQEKADDVFNRLQIAIKNKDAYFVMDPKDKDDSAKKSTTDSGIILG